MNNGTKIRTVARIAASAFAAFCVWQTVVDSFGNKTVSLIWAILIIICGWIVDFATTYFNNDFTEDARIGTGITRQRKAEKKPGYVGERFFTEEPEDEKIEEVQESVYGENGEAMITEEDEDEHNDI